MYGADTQYKFEQNMCLQHLAGQILYNNTAVDLQALSLKTGMYRFTPSNLAKILRIHPLRGGILSTNFCLNKFFLCCHSSFFMANCHAASLLVDLLAQRNTGLPPVSALLQNVMPRVFHARGAVLLW